MSFLPKQKPNKLLLLLQKPQRKLWVLGYWVIGVYSGTYQTSKMKLFVIIFRSH